MTPLLQQFIQEGQDLLQAIGEKLMALETSPADTELMGELFRSVHTLKGNSGLFDFPEMTRVLHAAEDLMDAVRDGRVYYSTALADRLLDATDFVSVLLDEIGAYDTTSATHVTRSHQIAGLIRELLPTVPADEAVSQCSSVSDDAAIDIQAHVLAFCEEDRAAAWRAASNGSALFVAIYRPDTDSFYKGEDPFYSARHTPGLIAGKVVARAPWPPLATLDCYQCMLEFRMLLALPRCELEEHFRYTPEQVEIIAVPPFAMIVPDGDRCRSPASAAFINEAIELLNKNDLARLHDFAWAMLQLYPPEQWSASLLRWVLLINETAPQAAGLLQALILALERLELPDLTGLQVIDPSQAPDSGSSHIDFVGAHSHPSKSATSDAQESAKVDRPNEGGVNGKLLKVDQAKVDLLMDLIGEMVVAKNALPYLANRAESEFGVRELSRDIKTLYAVINRIAEDMQHTIMQVRMTPISSIFQRFPRLVRDISRKLGKQVELILEGEATEADKNIVEALAEPLIHIVRNSLDHGLETPEDRARSGKPSTGTLSIRARQEPDRFIVEVSDDGQGIDPSRIKRKAFEKGLIDQGQFERLSSQQALNLIFAAGFSTAEVVTDLSGRGVGMDVVKTAIDKLGGSVELSSEVGRGTTLQLTLPLSMTISSVMIVEADQQIFGVPMEGVVETVRINSQHIHTIKDKKTVILRDRVVPLVSLYSLLSLTAEPRVNEEGELAVLVIKVNHEIVGLLVDAFNEVVDVILKPLPGDLEKLYCYSGSALLGDGSVLMVLNPKELLS